MMQLIRVTVFSFRSVVFTMKIAFGMSMLLNIYPLPKRTQVSECAAYQAESSRRTRVLTVL